MVWSLPDRIKGDNNHLWGQYGAPRWEQAPTIPSAEIDGTKTDAYPTNYLRLKDNTLQQMWQYVNSAGRVVASEWLPVPSVDAPDTPAE